jgi:hypothetical protein
MARTEMWKSGPLVLHSSTKATLARVLMSLRNCKISPESKTLSYRAPHAALLFPVPLCGMQAPSTSSVQPQIALLAA